VTTSGSGLDPDVSPGTALAQAGRIAQARGVGVAEVTQVIEAEAHGPWLGLFGLPRVNVLQANLALDAALGVPTLPAP
jgi:K+-transporting ATPase ATPase C chain